MSLTAKQEQYAQNIAKGMNQSESYRNAYDAENMADETIWARACELAKDSKVSVRIEELKNELQLSMKYDREAHFRELDIYKAKYEEINPGAVTKMIELKGKLCGLYVDKVESKVEIKKEQDLSNLTDEELIEYERLTAKATEHSQREVKKGNS